MNDIQQTARLICHAYLSLKQKDNINDDLILNVIREKIVTAKEFQDVDISELFESLRADLSIGKGEITILSEDITPWLSDEKANISFGLWNRYKLYISENDSSFPINDLDDYTDKILDRCVNPKTEGSWDRRGMVVGHVQSGKTANYVGLMNKATDAGYKVVIIIAGSISSLRRQTQERIDKGYIGRSSSAFIRENENKVTGVGKYKVETDIYSLTSSYYKAGDEGDFNQAVANRLNIPIGNNPVVFVIKKNKSILENLIDWFSKNENTIYVNESPKIFNVPALIIDDEADSASVNATKDINEVNTINRLIRTLLNLFDQKTFIGYTATPYANLFISHEHNEELTTTIKGKSYKIGEDLFPRDFIINLKSPSNYIGAAKIFGYENPISEETKDPLDVFRSINDYDPPFFRIINRDNKFDLPEYLPISLKTAIKSFILTCAIRRVRKQETKHNSMLIHVALLVKWIDRIAHLVNEQVREYKNAIESEDKTILGELRELYESDFIPTTNNVLSNIDYKDIRIRTHKWEEVEPELKKAVLKIDVFSVHGTKSTSSLEYHKIEEIDYEMSKDNGLSVIAVGGSRLSRGITLEGLSVSYYLRTTKMYDSLMQMGRWFGYRPGYVDLCRLYTNEDIFGWFNHITMATEEMRNDFDEMTASHQRPKDFRLKVRNHHGLLTITSLTKMYFAEKIEISFSGTNPQTYQLIRTKRSIENNFTAFKSLINSIGFPPIENRILTNQNKIRYLLYRNQNIEPICDFIDAFEIDQPSIKNATLSDYIRKQYSNGQIGEWSICIVSNTDENVYIQQSKFDDKRKPNKEVISYNLNFGLETITLGCSVRNQPFDRRGSGYYTIAKNQIDDMVDRQVDLSIKGLKKNSEIKEQRSLEKKGLLLIYALDERGTNLNYGIPIIGFSIHFPRIEKEEKISYTTSICNGFDDNLMDDDDSDNNFLIKTV